MIAYGRGLQAGGREKQKAPAWNKTGWHSLINPGNQQYEHRVGSSTHRAATGDAEGKRGLQAGGRPQLRAVLSPPLRRGQNPGQFLPAGCPEPRNKIYLKTRVLVPNSEYEQEHALTFPETYFYLNKINKGKFFSICQLFPHCRSDTQSSSFDSTELI